MRQHYYLYIRNQKPYQMKLYVDQSYTSKADFYHKCISTAPYPLTATEIEVDVEIYYIKLLVSEKIRMYYFDPYGHIKKNLLTDYCICPRFLQEVEAMPATYDHLQALIKKHVLKKFGNTFILFISTYYYLIYNIDQRIATSFIYDV